MKGATEVPSTITVIIIQYTLIKRMKCELAFPISPTYCLNVKYSSHGLSPWKHTGAVGVSHLATALLPQEWRNGGIWGESWNQENTAKTCSGFLESLELLSHPFPCHSWHKEPVPVPRSLCCSPWDPEPCWESWVSDSPEGPARCPWRLRSANIWNIWTKSTELCHLRPSKEPGNFLKHCFPPCHPRITQDLTLSSPEAQVSLFIHCPSFTQEATTWAPALVQNTFQRCWGTEIRWFVAFPSWW